MKYVLNKCLVEDNTNELGASWHTGKPKGDFKKFQVYIGDKYFNQYSLSNGDQFKVVFYASSQEVADKMRLALLLALQREANIFDDGYELTENSPHKGDS